MGQLRADGDAVVWLRAQHRVGRSRANDLVLEEPSASGEHAILCWVGSGWQLRDLGSRNGTRLEGQRLAPGERVTLERGQRISFGQSTYTVMDTGSPRAHAMEQRSGAVVLGEGPALALPGPEHPEITIWRSEQRGWLIEEGGLIRNAQDRELVALPGQIWQLHLPEPTLSTLAGELMRPDIGELGLRFRVSLDEESVAMWALAGGEEIELGVRTGWYLLLTLARARLADAREASIPESAHGWLPLDELIRRLDTSENKLNVDIFRARKALASAGVDGAAGLVERRPQTRQIRLGLSRVEIERG